MIQRVESPQSGTVSRCCRKFVSVVKGCYFLSQDVLQTFTMVEPEMIAHDGFVRWPKCTSYFDELFKPLGLPRNCDLFWLFNRYQGHAAETIDCGYCPRIKFQMTWSKMTADGVAGSLFTSWDWDSWDWGPGAFCFEKFPQQGPKKERFRNGSRYWIVSIRSCCKMFYQLIEWILSQYTTSIFVHTTVSDDWHTVRLCGKEAVLCTECLKPRSRDRSLDGTLSQQDLDGWQKTHKQIRKHWMETNTAEARTIVPQ